MKQIAVIMPVYKAHDTIQTTLHSIYMQRNTDYHVYAVVDGEEVGSYDYLKGTFTELSITYLEKNGGPGVARQYGIDHTKEPFISFIDADDTYLSSMSLYYQLKPFDDEKIVIVSSSFLQEKQDNSMKLQTNDMVWMHGKMYKRAFLDKYTIRFNDTRMNEDVGVNTQCQCFANENEQIYMSQDVTYMWQWRDNSIVRTNGGEVAYTTSVDGYVINKIYAFEKVTSQKNDESVQYFMIGAMTHLFKKYLGAMIKAPKQIRHINKWAKKYYNAVYAKIDKDYLERAEATILVQNGFNQQGHHDEYHKWLKKLEGMY